MLPGELEELLLVQVATAVLVDRPGWKEEGVGGSGLVKELHIPLNEGDIKAFRYHMGPGSNKSK